MNVLPGELVVLKSLVLLPNPALPMPEDLCLRPGYDGGSLFLVHFYFAYV